MAILPLVERGEVVQGLPDIGMARRQRLFAQRQTLFEKDVGLLPIALNVIKVG